MVCTKYRQKEAWEEIIQARQQKKGERWCVLEDFNSILREEERKKGGNGVKEGRDAIVWGFF